MNKILVNGETDRVKPLAKLIGEQNHRTLVLWTLDCANRMVSLFESRISNDDRPRLALVAAEAWSKGDIFMPIAKKAAHATHHAATEAEPIDVIACAAARACGHALGTIHVQTHAMAFVFYTLTALIRAADSTLESLTLEKECAWLTERLLYWIKETPVIDRKWASFL